MNLSQKQRCFSLLIARFILALRDLGYQVSLGEAWRPPEMAMIYENRGTGISNSLHTSRLAVDLNLFKGGIFLTKTDQYKEAGELWESYSNEELECCWGGRFKDSSHFSISHGGVK